MKVNFNVGTRVYFQGADLVGRIIRISKIDANKVLVQFSERSKQWLYTYQLQVLS